MLISAGGNLDFAQKPEDIETLKGQFESLF